MNEPKVDDAGIGAAAIMGIEIYDHACRGSGRTHRMVMALKPGTTVLCKGEPRWLEAMIRDLRGKDFDAKVVSCGSLDRAYEAIGNAKARRRLIAMDHHLIADFYLETVKRLTRDLAHLGIEQHNETLMTNKPPPAAMFRLDR